MASSGVRIGSWEYFRWKHVEPVRNNQGELIAARLIVYAGERDQYYCFITPEAYRSLDDWMQFRASYGETITGESWLMRDIGQTTNSNYAAKPPKNPPPIVAETEVITSVFTVSSPVNMRYYGCTLYVYIV